MGIRDRIKELRRVKAKDLIPNSKNWRVHPKAQANALRGLLAEVGYADALLARETPEGLMLIDGHLRAETTPKAMVPVLVLDVDEAEADKLLLTLDPLAGMAEADAERLRVLLETVRTDSSGVGELLERIAVERAQLPDRSPTELSEPEAPIDRAAELRTKWGTECGQIWRIGPHRLLCADCRTKPEVDRLWPAGAPRVRMLWTDPPYGVSYADKNNFLNKSDRENRIQKPIVNDHLTEGQTEDLFRDALTAAVEHCIPGAACYATVPAGRLQVCFMRALEQAGFSFRHGLVWVKNQFVLGLADYHHRHEPILYGWLENGPHLWIGGRSQDSVFEVDRPHLSDFHPTTKPVALIAQMICNSSRRSDLVFDPFCGSGSTLLAAAQLDRIGYGVEIDPGYVAVTLERLSALGLSPELVN